MSNYSRNHSRMAIILAVLLSTLLLSCDDDEPTVPLDGDGHLYRCVGFFAWQMDCITPMDDANPQGNCSEINDFSNAQSIPNFEVCGNEKSPPDVTKKEKKWCMWKCKKHYGRKGGFLDFLAETWENIFGGSSGTPGQCIIEEPINTYGTY